MREIARYPLGAVTFEDEVQLPRHILVELGHDHAEVEVRLEPRQDADQDGNVPQVGLHHPVDTRVLHFHGDVLTVFRTCPMNLGQRRRGDRPARKVVEDGIGVGAKLALDHPDNLAEWPGGHPVLQSAEDSDVFRRSHVGPAADELAGLDQQAFHPRGEPVDPLRARTVSCRDPALTFSGRKLCVPLDALVAPVDQEEGPAHVDEALRALWPGQGTGAGYCSSHTDMRVAVRR